MEKEKLKALLDDMSLKEKADQMLQLMGAFYQEDMEGILTGPARDMGVGEEDIQLAGSILGTYGAGKLKKLQKEYMEKQPHHIPMLFMMDVIHGMKTVFPMPLAQGAAFDPELSEKCAAAAAKEAAVSGLHVTFSPMVDLVRDARWGRVMESTGEDPYLNSRLAQAQVKGFQGEDMGAPYKVCSCIKHFAAYGGAQAGRDYNTVELCEHTLRDFYLPSYKAGIDAGAGMVMTSFNTINGIPASTNKWLMRDVLRKEMGFDGVLISDFSAILETVAHGHSKDEADAARKALEAGVDIDMMTSVYSANLCRLGLFENPYKDADEEEEKTVILCKEHRNLAREAAGKSFVLLKNEGLLPVTLGKKTAFIGPYTDNKEIISSWAILGDVASCVTIKEAAEKVFDPGLTTFHPGSPVLSERELKGLVGFGPGKPVSVSEEEQEKLLQEAVEAAKEADLVIMPLGEHYLQSGEATSRGMIDLPEAQVRLLREVAKVNENIAVVLFTGRPLDLREVSRIARSVLVVWLPGTEGGAAVVDALTGKVNPSGKLPMSFPYCTGQIPVHYNAYSTGRPDNVGEVRFRSKYIDIPNEPLYPFGYGLSYTKFEISPVKLSGGVVTDEKAVTAGVTVKNTGERAGTEVVQLYLQDIAASVVRPVRELKGFVKVELEAGEEKEITFVIDEPMLRFLRADGTVGSEEGEFNLFIGNSSDTENRAKFRYEA